MHYIHNLRFQIISFGFFPRILWEKIIRNGQASKHETNRKCYGSKCNKSKMKQKKKNDTNSNTVLSFANWRWCNPSIISTHQTSRSRDLFVFQCFTYIFCVCVCCAVLILLFLSEPYFGISMGGNNPWWLISYWNIACTGWLAGYLAGPNQMQIVQFNAVFAAVSFCCYTHTFFSLCVSFAASFNTQILECYKCEHSWAHGEPSNGGGNVAKKNGEGRKNTNTNTKNDLIRNLSLI